MNVLLPDDLYPFHEARMPLIELAMIQVPPDLQAFLSDQARRQGIDIVRDEPVELRCPSEQAPESAFLVFWPSGDGPMHMLAPKRFQTGRA